MFKPSKLVFNRKILNLIHYYITATSVVTTMTTTTSNINVQLEKSQKPEG